MLRLSPNILPIGLVALGLSAAAGMVSAQELYPEGSDTPKSMTRAEALRWLTNPPLISATDPPTGLVRCVAEYEQMEGILVCYDGTSSQNGVLTEMAKHITGANGNALLYCVVDTTSERTSVSNSLIAAGVDINKVRFIVVTTDTIWIRDYGPRYIYQGNCRAIVDHVYNRPRPNDDAFPFAFQTAKNHALYGIPLVHGGGNFHLNATGSSFVTRLINNENSGLSEQQIWQHWKNYQNVDTTFFTPFPTSIDLTQHIDMWMQVIADNKVIISDWPDAQGSTQDNICEAAATTMAGRGFTVFRTPAFTFGGTHYTYTNVVMCNGVVMIPSFTQGTNVAQRNAQALATFQQALPTKQIIQVNAQPLITSAGALHCVVMHVPAPLGGSIPTAYVVSPNGGETFVPGQQVTIKWVSDDDIATDKVEIRLSLDGGANFPIQIAANETDDRSFVWTVPDVYSSSARIRITVVDQSGNAGIDDSDANFTIKGQATATLTRMSILAGKHVAGGVTEASQSDDQWFTWRHIGGLSNGGQVQGSIASTAFSLSNAFGQAASLELQIESKASAASTAGELWLRNQGTGQWVLVHTFAVLQTDQVVTLSGLSGSYVRGDGLIEGRIVHRSSGSGQSRTSSIDAIIAKVRPL